MDAARLASVTGSQAERFRNALLSVGYLPSSQDQWPDVLEMRNRAGRNLPRLLHATAAGRPLDSFVRLFLLGLPVPVPAARAAMSTVALEEWCDAGLVRCDGGQVQALLAIYPYEGLLLAFDRPDLVDSGASPDYVCGLTNSSARLAGFMSRRAFSNVLDLGTGCGVLAFLAARQAAHVLATDVNPRAIGFASFNARLNGITNVEFAAGSTFEPAAGRKFDLIITNPPIVIGPFAHYTYRDSGLELDGLCRQIVAGAPAHLNKGGMLQCTAQWPNFKGAEWNERPVGWFEGMPCDALVLHLQTLSALQHCEETVTDTESLDTAEQARLYALGAAYFQQREVTSVSEGLIAMRQREGANWVRTEDVSERRSTNFGDTVENYFETSDELEQIGDKLLDMKLRMAPGLSITTSHRWNGARWDRPSYEMRQSEGLELKATVDASIANLIRRCDGATKVRDLIAGIAEDAKVSPEAITQGCQKLLRQMLDRGFLVQPGDHDD